MVLLSNPTDCGGCQELATSGTPRVYIYIPKDAQDKVLVHFAAVLSR